MPTLYAFPAEQARVLRQVALKSLAGSRNLERPIYPQLIAERAGLRALAKVGGTAIPAATESVGVRTPGTGTVTLQVIDASGDIVDYEDDSAAAVTVTVNNWSLEASGTNTYIWVEESVLDGKLYYVNEPC